MTTQTTYQYRSPCIQRYGSSQRTIYYSIPTSERNFDYQNLQKTNADLNGRSSRHIIPKQSKEISKFSNFKVHPLPNSKRTLIPTLAPEPKQPKPQRNDTFSQSRQYLNSTSLFQTRYNYRSRHHPKLYKSFELADNAPPEPYKRLKGASDYFNKYEKQSQISTLPGSVHRAQEEISDWYDTCKIRNNESFAIKINKDYDSKVSCLGGNINENDNKKVIAPIDRRYYANDMFNTDENRKNDCSNKTNWFNQSGKKRNEDRYRKNFGYSNSFLNSERPTTGIRRNKMRNLSQIQIF